MPLSTEAANAGEADEFDSNRIVAALVDRLGLCHIEVELTNPEKDWMQLRDIIVSCTCLQSIVCRQRSKSASQLFDALMPQLALLQGAVRAHAPGLVHLVIGSYRSTEIKEAFVASDRTCVV